MPDQTPAINLDAKQLAKEVTSLAVVNDVRPPLFSGKAGEDVTAWIGVYLSLFAASWYAKETRDEDYKAQIKRELNNRKMVKGEPAEDYFNDVLTLCDKYDREMDDDDIIEKLRNGLSQGHFWEKSTEDTLPAPTEMIVSADTVAAAEATAAADSDPAATAAVSTTITAAAEIMEDTETKVAAPLVKVTHSRPLGTATEAVKVEPAQAFEQEGGGGGSRRDRPPVTCYTCGGPHIQRHCPENQTDEGRGGGNH
ncbi:hypothetical protein BV898_05279 [Hypsibius exemplaris]|uniref:CCHC-type domain-containing protein n=1 Tax=Hypsibius exemplaris TaxID=2072580 RepID=A0A1W0WZP4_HYPEX|nr:hypothetical protein BV898_05279 [Hypsibius exemplaris]